MLALRAASRGLCRGRGKVKVSPGIPRSAGHPPPQLPTRSRLPLHTCKIVDTTGIHEEEHKNISAPMALPPTVQPPSRWRESGCWSLRGTLTSLLVDGGLLVDIGIWASGLCGEGATVDEKEVVMMGRDDSDNDGKAGPEKGMETWIGRR